MISVYQVVDMFLTKLPVMGKIWPCSGPTPQSLGSQAVWKSSLDRRKFSRAARLHFGGRDTLQRQHRPHADTHVSFSAPHLLSVPSSFVPHQSSPPFVTPAAPDFRLDVMLDLCDPCLQTRAFISVQGAPGGPRHFEQVKRARSGRCRSCKGRRNETWLRSCGAK